MLSASQKKKLKKKAAAERAAAALDSAGIGTSPPLCACSPCDSLSPGRDAEHDMCADVISSAPAQDPPLQQNGTSGEPGIVGAAAKLKKKKGM